MFPELLLQLTTATLWGENKGRAQQMKDGNWTFKFVYEAALGSVTNGLPKTHSIVAVVPKFEIREWEIETRQTIHLNQTWANLWWSVTSWDHPSSSHIFSHNMRRPLATSTSNRPSHLTTHFQFGCDTSLSFVGETHWKEHLDFTTNNRAGSIPC